MHSKYKKTISFGIVLVFLLGIGVYFLGDDNNTVASESLYSEDFFIDSTESSKIESPELNLIQENSLKGNSPPIAVTPQILGSLSGEPETRKEITEYIVGEGDNLWSIADKFNISINTILWANDLNSKSIIKPDQKLIILPVSGVIHFVKNGDTLSGIAKTYKGKTSEIAYFNNIEDEKIFIGDAIVIPGGKKPTASYIANVPLASTFFVFPTTGIITQKTHWYNAIDVANKCGTPIYAAAGGTVQKAGYISIGGNRVRIIHSNNIVTYYGHLSKILVKPGQKVSQGQVIGYMRKTGYSTGCHIHFETRGATNPLAKYKLGASLKWK